MSVELLMTVRRIQDHMDEILTNFKPGAQITVLVRTPGKPTADFCLTSDDLSEVAAMIKRRQEAAASAASAPELHQALKTALDHIEHMAAFIGNQKAGYSFESLGEDMPGMRAALKSSGNGGGE